MLQKVSTSVTHTRPAVGLYLQGLVASQHVAVDRKHLASDLYACIWTGKGKGVEGICMGYIN
jgi:hypothetical protein